MALFVEAYEGEFGVEQALRCSRAVPLGSPQCEQMSVMCGLITRLKKT
jgi:hypothetical protein